MWCTEILKKSVFIDLGCTFSLSSKHNFNMEQEYALSNMLINKAPLKMAGMLPFLAVLLSFFQAEIAGVRSVKQVDKQYDVIAKAYGRFRS